MIELNHEASFRAVQEEARKRRQTFKDTRLPRIHIGMATCGIASGALKRRRLLKRSSLSKTSPPLFTRLDAWATVTPSLWSSSKTSGFPQFFTTT